MTVKANAKIGAEQKINSKRFAELLISKINKAKIHYLS
jgi:hypothetical protein